MYSSSYSRAKLGPETREPLHKPKGKSCGYYMRIVFFFSSLIQSLIIVSLVLFLIYGQPEKTAAEKRVKELELGFNRLSDNNIKLRKEKADLETQLKARADEKAALEKEMAKQKTDANKTEHDLKKKVASCTTSLTMMSRRSTTPIQPPVMVTSNTRNELDTLRTRNAQHEALIKLINSNFTQMVQILRNERDDALRDRAQLHEEAIKLRSDNTIFKEQLITYTRKCKEDFANSLNGITTVTREFLNRINNLFPHQLTFHLTCNSQREQMEKIKTSCTNLSREVENKFQVYLNNVGNTVAEIQAKSSQLEVENRHLISNFQECQRSHTEFGAKAARQLELKQKTHDDKVENLLVEMNRLRAQLSNIKSSSPNPGGLQAAPQQGRQTAANWPSVEAPGIRKTPTVS